MKERVVMATPISDRVRELIIDVGFAPGHFVRTETGWKYDAPDADDLSWRDQQTVAMLLHELETFG